MADKRQRDVPDDADEKWFYYGARQISRCNTALTVCLGVAGIMAV